MGTITVRAHAKINLSLRVLARRPDDGYHDLRTVFQALALHDTLTFLPRPGPFALEASDPRLPADESNLVWRAAGLLWKHLGRDGVPRDLLVRIDKCIPMKGGLGGGSADAAAALIGLARVWDADVPSPVLLDIGRQLGADVGFFFTGGAALGEGRGDQICPLPDLPRLGVLLVVPPFDVSTADAYRWIDEARGWTRPAVPAAEVRTSVQRIPQCPWPTPLDEVTNDFEAVIAPKHPELDEVKRAIAAAGAVAVAMTGSGSTVFGLFDDDGLLRTAADEVAGIGQAVASHTLGRSEYLEASTPRAG
jgi:4-diphosphocytidyl-2-C-methyl-D-erythritol kinase